MWRFYLEAGLILSATAYCVALVLMLLAGVR